MFSKKIIFNTTAVIKEFVLSTFPSYLTITAEIKLMSSSFLILSISISHQVGDIFLLSFKKLHTIRLSLVLVGKSGENRYLLFTCNLVTSKNMDSSFDVVKQKMKGRKPKNKTCSNCKTEFREVRDLERHEKNRQYIDCLHCDKKFCNMDHFHKHLRSNNTNKNEVIDYELSLCDKTGYENDPNFKQLIADKHREIEDNVQVFPLYKIINKKIDSSFTYGDLDDLLNDTYAGEKNCFKINMGLAYIIYNPILKEYRYHYISSNALLFEHALTITNRQSIDKFIQKVFNLDLASNRYLNRPDSVWTLAGITNLQLFVYELSDTPIGRPPLDLPDYIINSKSIIALLHNGHKPINDDRCMFRCLALHFGSKRERDSKHKQKNSRNSLNHKLECVMIKV